LTKLSFEDSEEEENGGGAHRIQELKKIRVASLHDVMTEDKRLSKQPAAIIDKLTESPNIKPTESIPYNGGKHYELKLPDRDRNDQPRTSNEKTTDQTITSPPIENPLRANLLADSDVNGLRLPTKTDVKLSTTSKASDLKISHRQKNPSFSKKGVQREHEVSFGLKEIVLIRCLRPILSIQYFVSQ
jgi:hypothetical protein